MPERFYPRLDQIPYFGGGMMSIPTQPSTGEGSIMDWKLRGELRLWKRGILTRSIEYLKHEDRTAFSGSLETFLGRRLKGYVGKVLSPSTVEEDVTEVPEDLRDVVDHTRGAHHYLPVDHNSSNKHHFTNGAYRIDFPVSPRPGVSRIALVFPDQAGEYPGWVFERSADGITIPLQGKEFTLHELAEAMTALPPRI